MKLPIAILLLALSSATFAAPRPRPTAPAIVLQNGTHASIQNGQLTLIGADGKKVPAPAGHYTTQDGKQLNVGSNGRLASDSPAPVPALARGAQANPVTQQEGSVASVPPGATVRPSRPLNPRTEVAGTNGVEPSPRAQVAQPPSPSRGQVGTPNDIANAMKNQDAVLKALYELTVKVQAMETKQAAQLQAIETKEAALEQGLKALQASTIPVKNEIIAAIVNDSVKPSMQADYLDLLKAINESTKGLPHADVNSGDKTHTLDFWWKIWENSKHASELADQEMKNGGW